jgi:threonine/homoserine/homoserine lactone efflux protein
MVWLILAAAILVEWYLVTVAIWLIGQLPRAWLRWPVWSFLVLVLTYGLFCAGALAVKLAGCFSNPEHTPWWYLFLPSFPRPTARLLLLVTSATFWLLFIGLGLAGLLRGKANPPAPRARNWLLSRMFIRLGASAALLLSHWQCRTS